MRTEDGLEDGLLEWVNLNEKIREDKEALTQDNLFEHALKCSSLKVFHNQLLAASHVNIAVKDKKGRTLLHYLAERTAQDNLETAQALINFLKDKVSPNKKSTNGQIPLHVAIKSRNLNIFKALAQCSDFKSMLEDWTLLHYGVKYYHSDIFSDLTKNISVDFIHMADDEGLTPMNLAEKLYQQSSEQLTAIREKLYELSEKAISVSKAQQKEDEAESDRIEGRITRSKKRKKIQQSSSSEGELNMQRFMLSQDEKILKLNELVAILTNNKEDQEQVIKKLNGTIEDLQSQLDFVVEKNRSLAEENIYLKNENTGMIKKSRMLVDENSKLKNEIAEKDSNKSDDVRDWRFFR